MKIRAEITRIISEMITSANFLVLGKTIKLEKLS